MKPILRRSVIAVCVLVLAVVVLAWIDGPLRGNAFIVNHQGQTGTWVAASNRRSILMGYVRSSPDPPQGWVVNYGSIYKTEGSGFDLSSSDVIPFRIAAPHWFVSVVLSIWPVCVLMKWRRQRLSHRHGKCPTCNYDLRASAGICPECGANGDRNGV